MVQLARIADGLEVSGAFRIRSGVWIALRTKSRQEKAVARCAAALGIHYYLPLIQRGTIIRGRKLVSQVPVFPGYVFLNGQLDDAYEPALAPRVCQIIAIRDQARFVGEIAQVQRALESPLPVELYPFAVCGRRCRVARGPLEGVEGVVLERKKGSRLILQVDIIGQAVALEIDADMLEAVD